MSMWNRETSKSEAQEHCHEFLLPGQLSTARGVVAYHHGADCLARSATIWRGDVELREFHRKLIHLGGRPGALYIWSQRDCICER